MHPRYQVNDLVRVTDLERTFSQGDTTNCSYKLLKTRETFTDTIPAYRINNLPEIYNEVLSKKNE